MPRRVHHGARRQSTVGPTTILHEHRVRVANVLLGAVLRAAPLELGVVERRLLQLGPQVLFADAVAVDRRIAGAGAAVRLRGGRRFERHENILVVAVEAAQRAFDVNADAGV